jgi:hypothetical protein
MGTPRLFPVTRRAAWIFALVGALSACATGGVARVASDPDAGAEADRGPRVQLWTASEPHATDRIRASFRLDDDAYIIVVNVGRDGYANVIFPESPDDDGFMRAGRTYRLPAFFPGFPGHTRSEYRRLYTATSAYDEVYDRYAGYVFVIASWRPMHFELSEAQGLWDNYRLAAHEERLDPYVVMHRFADQLVPGRSRDYTARFARYAAFDQATPGRTSFASCAAYQTAFEGISAWSHRRLVANGWVPVYGYGYSAFAPAGCGYGYGLRIVAFRPRTPPAMPGPVAPIPPRDSGDTAAAPRPRPPVKPRAVDRTDDEDGDDEGRRKSPPHRRRRDMAAGEDRIVDVTRESRERARRENAQAERVQRALGEERGYGRPETWRERTRATERNRAERPRDVERARARASDDDARARRERIRDEARDARSSEPRSAAPRRESSRPERHAEPRAERHAEPRAERQVEPHSRPAPRSEPTVRSAEPRRERPEKPDQR